jgi:HAAS
MKLIDNYLDETGIYLPKDQRDDILAELRELVQEQVADRASREERSATLEDEEAVLQGLGHPMKMARSYLPQRWLIGPALFPAYLRSLRVATTIVLAVQVLLMFATAGPSPSDISAAELFGDLLETAFTVFAVVTIVFAVLEVSGEKLSLYEGWRPESLGGGRRAGVDYGELTTNLITETVALLWWNGMIAFPDFSEHWGAKLRLTDAWVTLYWPVNLVFGLSLALHLFLVLRGQWRIRTLIAEVGLGIATLALIAILISSGDLARLEPAQLGDQQETINWIARGILLSIGAFALWDTVKCIRMSVRLSTAT